MSVVDILFKVYMYYGYLLTIRVLVNVCCFFFQAEDGIRDLVRSRGLGDVYKRQLISSAFLLFMKQLILLLTFNL